MKSRNRKPVWATSFYYFLPRRWTASRWRILSLKTWKSSKWGKEEETRWCVRVNHRFTVVPRTQRRYQLIQQCQSQTQQPFLKSSRKTECVTVFRLPNPKHSYSQIFRCHRRWWHKIPLNRSITVALHSIWRSDIFRCSQQNAARFKTFTVRIKRWLPNP